MNKPKVFISYSREDEAWKDQLLKHLKVSLDSDVLEVWDDTRIPVGSQWERELHEAIDHSRLAILLISADFLSSQYVRDVEVPTLLARSQAEDLALLPVLVRPCAWKTVSWIRDHQLFPGEGRALSGGSAVEIETDLAKIAEQVDQQLKVAA